ncbi:N-chimaerin [Cryptotermes secundus]|uniref:Beta-chimaerin n=1 Tax=Cryptotermes secundus TaxID=105785 RepID=A0A2J7PWS9_9NEOP|nr:beta-chimaerin [Cryptotermes secundus]PNF20787.1 N-chimaerin [Cryptotermes secundus]PNF20788.1 N-chimaerin [Cryptotermes secundus]
MNCRGNDEDSPNHEQGSPHKHVWNPNLYRLQQEAPRPKPVSCKHHITNSPSYYGKEFHGVISHLDASAILEEDGAYLVRQSEGSNGFHTLTLRFDRKIKHYKLYFDGQHYVRDKRFDSLYELVADGLVTLYMEANAGPYIELMNNFNNYEKSPYMTLNKLKRRAVIIQASRGTDISVATDSFLHKEQKHSEISGFQTKDPAITESVIGEGFISETVDYDKPHAFKIHTFKGLNWCEFCGNFLWGFTAQGVKCEDCGFSAHSKCSEKVPCDCCPDLKQLRGVFGIDLTTLVKAHRTARPFVVDKCISEIERRGLDAEGLYRVSGFAEEIETLKLALDKDGEQADMSPEVYDNINVIAGTLKLYLRLLPIPLVTFETHPALIKAAQLKSIQEQIVGIKDALTLLPAAHYNTLKYLMEHLNRVVQHQITNKMTAHNLSTVFAPTLMPAPDLSKCGGLPGMTYEISALETMITHQQTIFT